MNDKTETPVLLSSAQFDAVSGAWCGTPWPGGWGGITPIPDPQPDPWYDLMASRVDPQPTPWRAIGSRLDAVALNPQPLPPKEIFSF